MKDEMKDEKMAEDYFCDGCENSFEHENGRCSNCTKWQFFIAGLKAGRPQWHDLWKAPNDLPKNGMRVLVLLEDKQYEISSISTDNRWICTDYYTGEDKVIAWCELPTFDKE